MAGENISEQPTQPTDESAVPEAAPEVSQSTPEPTPEETAQELDELTGLDETRLYAILSYLTVLVLVPLLTKRDDPFINFHAKQGLVILLGFILAAIISATVFPIFGNLLFLLLLIGDVLGLVMALQGKRWKIPGVGHLAELFRI